MTSAEQTQLPRRADLSETRETVLPNEAKFAGAVDDMERTNPLPGRAPLGHSCRTKPTVWGLLRCARKDGDWAGTMKFTEQRELSP
jgi:hypothetical protein